MTGFSLNLDLTLYFEDLRKYACVFVDSTKCKEVGDVENHIKAVFKLEDNICLTNKKFLIPRCESISILQQYDTLKVQKCDFYDYQIHKNKKSNSSCDQSALNLIQSDRTIDLSCRPKQRFRINILNNQCILEAPATQLEDNQIENYPQQIVVSNEIVLDENSEAQTKFKIKNKKRKYDIQNGELADNNDENLTKILDMSVKKSKKKNKNDFAMVDETSQANVDLPNSCITQIEFDTKKVKKSKKKKKLLQDEEIDLSNTCWEHLIANERNSKKRKSQKHNLNEECNGGLAKDLSFSVNSHLENDVEESKQNVNTYEKGLKRKKHNSENKYIESDDQELSDNIHSKLNSEQNILQIANLEITKDLNVGFKISTKRIEDYKRGLEEKVYRQLLQKDSKNSCLELEEDPANLLHTCTVTNPSPVPQSNEVGITMNGEQFQGDNQASTKTDYKRKRIRKHNKKKKREKREIMCAIGPVLNRITTPPEVKSSPSSSDPTKHIYFNDDDFIEEMTIPSTPPAVSQSLLQGNLENESQNQSQDNTDSSTPKAAVETETWQQEFLKKTTITSQPLIFHRSAISSDKNGSPSISVSSRTSTPLVQNVVTVESECRAAIVVQDIPKELQSVSKSFTNCNGEPTVLNHLEDSKSKINLAKLDLKNVTLTDFPVIDKVVAEDFILFKVLKLSEKCEPICSNPILAKVKDTTHFPDRVYLQIVEGIEECDSSTRNFDYDEKCLAIVELSWSDIVEPRLFFP